VRRLPDMKKNAVPILFFLTFSLLASALCANPRSAYFPDADGLDSLTSPAGANWVTLGSDSLALYSGGWMGNVSTLNGEVWAASSFDANQEVYATLTALPTNTAPSAGVELILRATDMTAANCYKLSCWPGASPGCEIDVYSGGSYSSTLVSTAGGTSTFSWSAGDTIGLLAFGTDLIAYQIHNGIITSILGATDSTYTSGGYIGVDINLDGSAELNNFGGGTYTPQFPLTAVLDNFNYNGALHAGWSSSIGITANGTNAVATSSSGIYAAVWGTSYGASQEAYVDIPTLPTGSVGGPFVMVESDGAALSNNYYTEYNLAGPLCDISGTQYKGVEIGYSGTPFNCYPITFTAGDSLGIRVDWGVGGGNKLSSWRKTQGVWYLIRTYEDTSGTQPAEPSIGMGFDSTNAHVDNFGGGGISP
jgi:hypothetical protein